MTTNVNFECKEFEVRDFFLNTLEQTCRVQLNDSEAKITRSTSEGRILLEVQQDELANFFDCLPEQQDNNWGQEKMQLLRKISGLKAQLAQAQAQAQAKPDPSPARDNSLKSELKKVSLRLNNAQKDLSMKDGIIQSQNLQLAKMKGDSEALRRKLEENESVILTERKMLALARTNMEWEMEGLLQSEREDQKGHLNRAKEDLQKAREEAKSHQAQLKEQRAETEKLTAELRKSEDLLKAEKDKFQTRIATIRKDTERFRFDCEHAMEELRADKSLIMAAVNRAKEDLKAAHVQLEKRDEAQKTTVADLKKVFQDQLASDRLLWQQEKAALLEETEKTSASFAAQLQEDKSSHLAQLEKQDEEHQTIVADLKTMFEDQLASDRLLRQQESEETSASFAAQLHEQKQSLVDALQKAEQQQQSHRIECEELSKTAESAQQTLQEKEQEWTTTESSLRSELAELEDQIGQRKRRTRWYRRFLCA